MKRQIPYDENNMARGVKDVDFTKFDYIFGMDVNNVGNLKNMAPPDSTAKIYIFGEFDDAKPIADPYYISGKHGFEVTYQQCLRYSHAFLQHLGLSQQAKS